MDHGYDQKIILQWFIIPFYNAVPRLIKWWATRPVIYNWEHTYVLRLFVYVFSIE